MMKVRRLAVPLERTMSNALKCPNPACPYLFDPTTVPPGVVLACPRCGMRFTLGTPAAAPPPQRQQQQQHEGPTATFANGLPAAPPGYPPSGYAPPGYGPPPGYPGAHGPDPTHVAFGDMTPETAKADGEVGPRLPVRESKFQTMLLLAVGAIALTAAGIAVWYKMTHKQEPTVVDAVSRFKDLNLSFEPPPSPWTLDANTNAKLDSPFVLVYKRENPEAYMAYGAKDFKEREPRQRELRDVFDQSLAKIIDLETKKEYDEIDKSWMGQEVKGYKFAAMRKAGGSVEGEMMTVSHKGVGYWFLSWTDASDFAEQKAAFADGRKRCKLLDLRTTWKPKQSNLVPFKNNVIGYTILDAEGVWTEPQMTDEERTKNEGKEADKYLTAKIRQKGRDFHEEAELVVYVLDGGSNPLSTAQVHVERSMNADAGSTGSYTFKEETGPLEVEPVSKGTAPYVMLKVTNAKDPNLTWLIVVSGIDVGGKTIAVMAKCKWGLRGTFDGKFVQIASSLKAGG